MRLFGMGLLNGLSRTISMQSFTLIASTDAEKKNKLRLKDNKVDGP